MTLPPRARRVKHRRALSGMTLGMATTEKMRSPSIRAQDLPLYAAGVTHRGPYKDGPGEINLPVAIDGMVVEPGDLVLGDADGVLGVPFDAVPAVLAAAEAKKAAEEREMAAILAGTSDRGWVLRTLESRGCEIEP